MGANIKDGDVNKHFFCCAYMQQIMTTNLLLESES